MQQGQTQTPTPEEIDRAIIEALKVFARRGRFLREQRERAAQSTPTTSPPNAITGEGNSAHASDPTSN